MVSLVPSILRTLCAAGIILLCVPSNAYSQESIISQDPQLVVDADGFASILITNLAISGDGRFLAASAGKIVRVWDLTTNRLWCTLRGNQERQGYHIGFIDSISFSPDGQFLTVGVSDNTTEGSTREYDLSNPHELYRLENSHGGCTRHSAYSQDERYKASYG